MLDSERTFEIKVRSRWTYAKFHVRQQLFPFKRVLHGKEIVQYLQNYKRHEVDLGHSKKFL